MTRPLLPPRPCRERPRFRAIRLVSAVLLLGACHANAPGPGDISQYLCPNGLTLRLSFNEDRSVMRLSLKGHTNTLLQDGANPAAYSNGRHTVTLDTRTLRLQTAGVLLPQNCSLQIPAANAVAAGKPALSQISGSIRYRQRRALSPQAVVSIQLQDVSLMDVAAKTIASTTLDNPGQVPIPFTLSYDASQLESGHRYAVQVRIEENGQLRFINTRSYPVLDTPDATHTDIEIEPVATH